MNVLLIGPTALDYYGRPIKQRKLHLPGLTLPMLAAVTPGNVNLRLLSESVEPAGYLIEVPRNGWNRYQENTLWNQ